MAEKIKKYSKRGGIIGLIGVMYFGMYILGAYVGKAVGWLINKFWD